MVIGVNYDPILAKLLLVVIALIVGFSLSKLVARVIYQYRTRHLKSISLDRTQFFSVRLANFLILTITVITCLLILQVNIFYHFLPEFYGYLPNLFSLILLIVLSVIVINFIDNAILVILRNTGVTDYLRENNQLAVVTGVKYLVSFLLYLLAILAILGIYGINIEVLAQLFTAIIIAIVAVAAALIFIALKDIASNMGGNIFVTFSSEFKIGKYIRIDGEEGEIKKLGKTSITLTSTKGETVLIPNKLLLKSKIYFRKIKSDLSTLESIQRHFVSQKPSYCGPSCAAIALSIFGIKATQEELGDKADTIIGQGTHPVTLGKVVEQYTNNKVIAVWIDYDKIHDLKQEIISWLNDDALIMVDYKKNFVFPQSKKAHYSLCVGVEGDDLLLIDPSSITGGVYYVDYNTIYQGMNTYSDLIQGKRGYMVFAPKGSTGYHRVQNGLLYADRTLYKNLTKTLEHQLDKVFSKKIFDHILPPKLKKFIQKWEQDEKIIRVWKP